MGWVGRSCILVLALRALEQRDLRKNDSLLHMYADIT
jgi:hypothetical protein